MAKDKKILIQFDSDIMSGVEESKGAFTVTGLQYKYVGGPLLNKSYPVISSVRPEPPRSVAEVTSSIFAGGTAIDTVYDNGITLRSVE